MTSHDTSNKSPQQKALVAELLQRLHRESSNPHKYIHTLDTDDSSDSEEQRLEREIAWTEQLVKPDDFTETSNTEDTSLSESHHLPVKNIAVSTVASVSSEEEGDNTESTEYQDALESNDYRDSLNLDLSLVQSNETLKTLEQQADDILASLEINENPSNVDTLKLQLSEIESMDGHESSDEEDDEYDPAESVVSAPSSPSRFLIGQYTSQSSKSWPPLDESVTIHVGDVFSDHEDSHDPRSVTSSAAASVTSVGEQDIIEKMHEQVLAQVVEVSSSMEEGTTYQDKVVPSESLLDNMEVIKAASHFAGDKNDSIPKADERYPTEACPTEAPNVELNVSSNLQAESAQNTPAFVEQDADSETITQAITPVVEAPPLGEVLSEDIAPDLTEIISTNDPVLAVTSSQDGGDGLEAPTLRADTTLSTVGPEDPPSPRTSLATEKTERMTTIGRLKVKNHVRTPEEQIERLNAHLEATLKNALSDESYMDVIAVPAVRSIRSSRTGDTAPRVAALLGPDVEDEYEQLPRGNQTASSDAVEGSYFCCGKPLVQLSPVAPVSPEKNQKSGEASTEQNLPPPSYTCNSAVAVSFDPQVLSGKHALSPVEPPPTKEQLVAQDPMLAIKEKFKDYRRKPIKDIIRLDLWSKDPVVVESALQQLTIDAFYDESARSQIARAGGLFAIVRAMEQHIGSPTVQVAACQALEKLALDNDNEIAIGDVGGVEAILGAMMGHFDCASVQRAAWSALWNLSCGNAGATMTVDTSGGIAAIVAAMKHHVDDPTVQKNACGALANLCLHHEERLAALAASDGFVAIARALQRHWAVPDVRREASHALSALLGPRASIYDVAVNQGVMPESSLLDAGDEEEEVEIAQPVVPASASV